MRTPAINEWSPQYLLNLAVKNLQDNFNIYSTTTIVTEVEDFPESVGNVITLDGGNWWIMSHLDLMGKRIVCNGITAISGFSSETSSITSTGLPNGESLLTSTNNIPIQNLTIKDLPAGVKAVNMVGVTGDEAIDWKGVNFQNVAEIGLVSNYGNFIMQDSAFLESAGLTFDGNCGTIGFSNTFFSLPTGTLINLAPTLSISRRFRIIYSSFVVTSGNIGIDADVAANIPVEGYILDTVNFAGGGTYIDGVPYNDNKALFSGCKGINNSASVAWATMQDNATPTPIPATNTKYKLLGTYSLPFSQKFGLSSNRVQCQSQISRTYKATATVTLESSNGNVIGVYLAKNGVPDPNSETYSTISGTGKSENVVVIGVAELVFGDTVDLYAENTTGTNAITCTSFSLVVEPVVQ